MMNKLLSVLLCFIMIISMWGCKNQAKNTTPSSTTLTTSSAVSTPEVPPVEYDLPLKSISMPVMEEYETAEDGTVIFNYSYQHASLILPDAQVAEKVTLAILNEIDASTDIAASVLESAKIAYSGQENWYPYSCSLVYNPMRLDNNILSLYGASAVFDGSPRSSSHNVSLNYDLSTGTKLSLSGILVSDYSADDLCSLIVDGLKGYEENQLYPGYEDLIDDLFTTNVTAENWYLSKEGLCFYFSPFEIGPVSTGTVLSTIPYERLVGLLKDVYHPAEEVDYAGQIIVERITGKVAEALEPYAEISEVVINDGGESVLVSTNGSLSSVHLEYGTFNSSGTEFMPKATVYYADSLCVSNALVIETYFTDAMPTLRLHYIAGGEEYSYYLYQSGENGSVVLSNN